MVSSQYETFAERPRETNEWWKFVRLGAAIVLGFLGSALLVATKTTAGAALMCAALVMGLTLSRLGRHKTPLNWVCAVLIAALCALAIKSISGTDIVPDQARTGYDFADRVLAISERFLENIGAKSRAERGLKHSPHER